MSTNQMTESPPTDIATTPIATLTSMGFSHPVLKNVMQRVFKPKDRDKLTVSAFGSAL
jgi:Holliday junction resolvasome RuvABC DNA-binding subunit